jgi:hypothetical protein
MATFDYKVISHLQPITLPSASLFMNTAATASYVRSVLLHNVSSSTEVVQMWLVPNNVTSSSMSDAWRFLNVGISGSSTFLNEFGAPGLMITESCAQIYATTTNNNGVNIFLVGGAE